MEQKIAKYWHLEDDRVVCDLCPRACRLKEGQRGFCFIRQVIGGKLISTTYGRSSGFAVDPIEKKPLNHFFPGSKIYSFGTTGCNMGCIFCQNWSISNAKYIDILQEYATPQEIAQKAKSLGCAAVAFTYNEPIIFAEYAIDTAIKCHELGLQTVAVTAGYISPGAREEFFSHMDAVNIDLKGFTDAFYQKYCAAHLAPILETVKYVKHQTKVHLELTTLLIPGANDSVKEINELTKWVAEELGPEIPLHFSAFSPNYRLTNIQSTPVETLLTARNIALKNGLQFVYTGNVSDASTQSTYCPKCRKLLIERDWYYIGRNHIKNSACAFCAEPIYGRF